MYGLSTTIEDFENVEARCELFPPGWTRGGYLSVSL
jgi:hypothetical protein